MLKQFVSIPIFYAVDDCYVPYLTVSISSLINHSNPINHYEIYILHQKLTKNHQVGLLALATKNVNIHLISMGKRLAGIQNEHNTLRGDYETLTIYYRLFISEMFPEYPRAVYLDADTIVLDDIAKLFYVNLHNNLLGAVPDAFARRYPDSINYVKQFLGLDMRQYFNSGVLVMDLQKLRQYHFIENFAHLINKYHFTVLAADQDYLNTMCQQMIFCLPTSWNVFPTTNKSEPINNPQLIHYAFFDKPWLHDSVSYSRYFWEMAAKTRFYPELLRKSRHDNSSRQKHEHQVIDGLLKHARQLIATTPSFASIYRTGKEHPLCLSQASKPLKTFTMPSKEKTLTPKSNLMMQS